METGVERQGIQEQDMQGRYMQELFRMQEVDIKEYSPLALAYIGDAVYELIIRSLVLNEGNRQVQKMHRRTSSMVQASAQARIITALNEIGRASCRERV